MKISRDMEHWDIRVIKISLISSVNENKKSWRSLDARAAMWGGPWKGDGKISFSWSLRHHSRGYPWLPGYRYRAASLLIPALRERERVLSLLLGPRQGCNPPPTVPPASRWLFMEMEQIRNKTRGYSFTNPVKKRLLMFPPSQLSNIPKEGANESINFLFIRRVHLSHEFRIR